MPKKARENPAHTLPGVGTPVRDGDIIVTYSELDTFRQCPLKWRWNYELLMSREPKPGTPLSRGGLWHEVLETRYWHLVNGASLAEASLQARRKHLLDDSGAFRNEDCELIAWMLDGYDDCYGRDPDWDILGLEVATRVPLGLINDSTPDSGPKFWLQLKIDALVRESDDFWIVDHKSAKDFSRQVEIDVDDQFGLYTWALRQLGIDILGFIRSDARTQRNKGPMTLDQRFRRIKTFRSETELENIRRDALATARAMHLDRRPVYSSPAPDRCSWRCDYLQAHMMLRKTGMDEKELLEDFGFSRRTLRHREYTDSYPPLP